MSINDFNPENPHDTPEGGSGEMYSELPERVVADVRRAFGRDEKVEVPAWVGLGLIAEFQAQHKQRAGRSKAIRFGVIAAALAIAVTAGMHYGGFRVKPTPAPTGDLAIQSGGKPGNGKGLAEMDVAGGVQGGPADRGPRELAIAPAVESSAKLVLKSARDLTASNIPSADLMMTRRAVTLDLDRNGRTDILDALILAKTMIEPAFYRDFDGGFDVDVRKSEEPVGILLAKAESSWDLTKDGAVDDHDLDALVAEIVKIGGA